MNWLKYKMEVFYMFKPKSIYYEKDIINYELGQELM